MRPNNQPIHHGITRLFPPLPFTTIINHLEAINHQYENH